jgi:hypothetical protein
MADTIFDKTDKGREEIATRKYRLAPRLRTLLLLIDGKQDKQTLLQKFDCLGLDEKNIVELLEQGFIRDIGSPVDYVSRERAALDAIYTFYTETIKSMIGLPGYSLQLRVEKAQSIEDFRTLRRPYLEAVLAAQGKQIACGLRDQLDQLLHPGTTLLSPATIAGLEASSTE